MEKDLKSNVVKDEALKQSFAEIKKAAETGKTTVAPTPASAVPAKTDAVKKDAPKTTAKKETKPAVKAETKTAKKAETKPAKKEAPSKKDAPKTAAKPAAKAETKTAAKKAASAKKETPKSATETKVSTSVVLQLHNHDYSPAQLQEQAIAAAQRIKADVKVVDVYVNVQESAAYYTIDGKGNADYRIDL